jgi:hypothetical protein
MLTLLYELIVLLHPSTSRLYSLQCTVHSYNVRHCEHLLSNDCQVLTSLYFLLLCWPLRTDISLLQELAKVFRLVFRLPPRSRRTRTGKTRIINSVNMETASEPKFSPTLKNFMKLNIIGLRIFCISIEIAL